MDPDAPDAFFLPDDDGPHPSREPGAVADDFVATVATAGPWSPALQHGGPPSALMVRQAERAAGGEGLVALRAAIDFLGAVPVGPVTVAARVTRPGRAIVGVDAALVAAGRTAMRARVWLLRLGTRTPTVGPDAGGSASGDGGVGVPGDAAPGSPDDAPSADLPWDFPYARSIEWRLTGGDAVAPGPAALWARQRIPLLAGEEPNGLQRAVTVADSGSGVSAVLDWDHWSFVNIDLDVHLLRETVGEWVHLDAVTRTSGLGSGTCSTTLHDAAGHLGSSAQTLVVQPR